MAFDADKYNQEECVQIVNLLISTTFKDAKLVAYAFGRGHRAYYWLGRKLCERKIMGYSDFYGMAAIDALHTFGLLPKWNDKKEKEIALKKPVEKNGK